MNRLVSLMGEERPDGKNRSIIGVWMLKCLKRQTITGNFEKQVARLLKPFVTVALQPVQEVARLYEVAGKTDVLKMF